MGFARMGATSAGAACRWGKQPIMRVAPAFPPPSSKLLRWGEEDARNLGGISDRYAWGEFICVYPGCPLGFLPPYG